LLPRQKAGGRAFFCGGEEKKNMSFETVEKSEKSLEEIAGIKADAVFEKLSQENENFESRLSPEELRQVLALYRLRVLDRAY
jgi:hypothetical protein